jgi:hypothetical protein
MKAASHGGLNTKAGLTTTITGAIVMATRSLSPKQILERTQQHRQAVMVLAHRRVRKAVERQLQEQGLKPRYMALREINLLAQDYLAQHGEQLRAEAEHAIATWPGFARWRLPSADITTNAQKQSEPISTTSALQISGAK